MIQDKCQVCGSPKLKTKKFCSSCLRLMKLKKQITAWDLSQEKAPRFFDFFFAHKFNMEKLKPAALNAINNDLEYRKSLKIAMEHDSIEGTDLEHLMRNLLSNVKGVNQKNIDRLYFGTANFFDWTFDPNQKRELYRFLKGVYYEVPMPSLTISIIHEYYKE